MRSNGKWRAKKARSAVWDVRVVWGVKVFGALVKGGGSIRNTHTKLFGHTHYGEGIAHRKDASRPRDTTHHRPSVRGRGGPAQTLLYRLCFKQKPIAGNVCVCVCVLVLRRFWRRWILQPPFHMPSKFELLITKGNRPIKQYKQLRGGERAEEMAKSVV